MADTSHDTDAATNARILLKLFFPVILTVFALLLVFITWIAWKISEKRRNLKDKLNRHAPTPVLSPLDTPDIELGTPVSRQETPSRPAMMYLR